MSHHDTHDLLILTFATERHGEVTVKLRNLPRPITRETVDALVPKLLASYRTKKHNIPLKEFRRAKLVHRNGNPLR